MRKRETERQRDRDKDKGNALSWEEKVAERIWEELTGKECRKGLE